MFQQMSSRQLAGFTAFPEVRPLAELFAGTDKSMVHLWFR
jgi:hypothetical protein